MSKFDLTNLILASNFGGNKAIADVMELPSIMVYIPKFKMSDVINGGSNTVHPAFIVNGKEIDGIWISKYENTLINNIPYSIPGEDPATDITFERAARSCANKGAGWHLMNALEWGAIALWCKKNGHLPNGNNDYGKDETESKATAIPSYILAGDTLRTATGTGNPSWSHNGALDGIYDLNGNVAEWCGGIRFIYGELQILENSRDMSVENWKAIDGTTGAFINPNGNGTTANSLKLNWSGSAWLWITGAVSSPAETSRESDISAISVDSSACAAAKEFLYALGLLSDDTTFDYKTSRINARNGAAKVVGTKGGHNTHDSFGAFAADFAYDTESYDMMHGFRAAYYEE